MLRDVRLVVSLLLALSGSRSLIFAVLLTGLVSGNGSTVLGRGSGRRNCS